MFSTCLFCHAALGANRELEAFPVGRRLAIDPERGRWWVVGANCARWNFTPLEERWEVIEACERAYRGTTQRVSTDNVGLARLRDGTDLVRIGRPLLPEFAHWRYGEQLGARRRTFFRRGLKEFGVSAAVNSPFTVLATAAMLGANTVGSIAGAAGAIFIQQLASSSYHAGRNATWTLTPNLQHPVVIPWSDAGDTRVWFNGDGDMFVQIRGKRARNGLAVPFRLAPMLWRGDDITYLAYCTRDGRRPSRWRRLLTVS